MVMLVRLVQPLNALLPIVVMLSGMVMLVRLVQPRNALLPIEVTDAPDNALGRTTFPEAEEASIKYAVFPEALIRYFMELVSSLKESPVLLNALFPIEVTLSGIVTLVRLVQA
jgi:hypothetical protein